MVQGKVPEITEKLMVAEAGEINFSKVGKNLVNFTSVENTN
jgi:hypothetical protein